MSSEFDEIAYLKINPDIVELVKKGQFDSGLDHYLQFGRQEGRVANYNELMDQLMEVSAVLKRTLAECERQIVDLNPVMTERDGQIANLVQTVAEYDGHINAIKGGTTWKPTSLMRGVLSKSLFFRRFLRRAMRLIWWTCTFQLTRRLQESRAARHRDAPIVGPHLAPPTDDYSASVPFSYNIAKWEVEPSLAVICHMYYSEMADEFRRYFLNIPFNFDLYITTDTQEKKLGISQCFSGWEKGKVEVRLAQNRGRDIAAKLIACRDVYDHYEFILHVHTKKSPTWGALNGWRTFLLETLLGTTAIVESVFEAFRLNPNLGLIAAQHFEPVRPFIGWGWNFKSADRFSRRMGIQISLDGSIDFPSGSMFWASSAALKPLLDLNLSFNDFPKETGQIDGTLGNVIERMYFLVCEKAGFSWMKIALPSMHSKDSDRIVTIESQGNLQEFMVNHFDPLMDSRGKVNKNLARVKLTSDKIDVLLDKKESVYRRAYEKSAYKDIMDIARFTLEADRLAENKESIIDFNESFYLQVNSDVAQAVALGSIPSGYIHYCLAGQFEKRIWSDHQLKRVFSQSPGLSQDFTSPVNLRSVPIYKPNLTALPESAEPFLLILFSHLQDDLFFAGYTEFFKDFKPIIDSFPRVVLSVEHSSFSRKLASRYSDRIEVIHDSQLSTLQCRPSLIVCFNTELFLKARDIFHDLDRTIYYCQEFESGFGPLGTNYIRGEMAIASSRNIIVSSAILHRFLKNKGLLTDAQNIFVTTPRIEPVHVAPGKAKRIFFYFRPEIFNCRNLSEILMEAAEQFCEKYTGYEIFMVGSVDTRYSYRINGNSIFVISKLANEEYVKLLSSCDVVVSMIYSAHPGVIAFQSAASGIPTVTNIFENRDALLLKRISDNIVPYDPVRESLLDRIETALTMPKGKQSFNRNLYGLDEYLTLSNFVNAVRQIKSGIEGELIAAKSDCNPFMNHKWQAAFSSDPATSTKPIQKMTEG